MAHEERSGVMCAVRTEVLQAGQISEESVCLCVSEYCGSIVVGCCCEDLVAEAGDSSGTHRKFNVRRWKPLLEDW